jgi:arsenate reductase
MLRIYTYSNCDTCRKAVKFLRAHEVPFQEIPIREQPPTLDELKSALAAADGQARVLFNTSGADYRAQGLGTKLPSLSESEILSLLGSNGNLVKRPFVVWPQGPTTGFQESLWLEKIAGLQR